MMRSLRIEQESVPASEEVRASACYVADGGVLGDGAEGEGGGRGGGGEVVAEADEVEVGGDEEEDSWTTLPSCVLGSSDEGR